METLPHIITDLAYILVIAGVVTILFKRLKQPLVLGYIVAGFLAGPNMPFTPSVADIEGIKQWGDIGVIFLMFTLGLEFSFKKIMRMGMQPIVATLCVMFSMFSIGSMVAYTFGWNDMDSLFLGGMLAMSSTTIIYKAFDDLGISSKPFAAGVISTLILEDILGILLMVMLSAVAVSNKLEGMQLVSSFLQLSFFLILCFIVGIVLVPTFFRRYRKYINTETLLIISVGLCFLLVVLSSHMGYSPAFGAFMMGSILSETMESERIEHTMTSLRNLFGAIFFVSVGMLVNPAILLQYWPAIVTITLTVILGQMIFGTFSFFLSGSSLRDAVQSGFSLVQIGEFAFIIAALGESLGVTSVFLYPVVVAVSIITTFFTPYVIKFAEPFYNRLAPLLPVLLSNDRIHHHNSKKRRQQQLTPALAWRTLLTEVAVQTVVFLVLCVALGSFCLTALSALCTAVLGEPWGSVLCAVLSLTLLSPIIRPIIKRRNKNKNARFLYARRDIHRTLYYVLIIAKFLLGVFIIFYMLYSILDFNLWAELAISVFLAWFMGRNRFIKYMSIYIERIFTSNFHFKDLQRAGNSPRYGRRLRGSNMHITTALVPMHSHWSGKSLSRLSIGHKTGVYVVAIVRGDERINIPGPSQIIYSGDVLEIAGSEQETASFIHILKRDVKDSDALLPQESLLSLAAFTLNASSVFVGKTMVEINLRAKYNCLVIGVENAEGNVQHISPQRPFAAGDKVWMVGESSDLALVRMCV